MVPASATRTALQSTASGAELAWRPANVPFSVGAELRALVLWGALLGALSVFILLGYVWVRLKVVEAGYRLSATRQLVERLELEGRELSVRAAASDATGRLGELAAARLGMHAPGAGEEEMLP
jgi:hypothetical protein